MLYWQHANLALRSHIHDRAQAATVRAGVLWQHFGKQSTHYFDNLTRQRQQDTVKSEIMRRGVMLHDVRIGDSDIWGYAVQLHTPEGRAIIG